MKGEGSHDRSKWATGLHRLFVWSKANPATAVSVILVAGNDRVAIGQILGRVRRLQEGAELIVAAVGSSDGTAEYAETLGAKVQRFHAQASRSAVMSAIAGEAQGAAIVFIEASGAPEADALLKLIRAVEQGTDVALNPAFRHPGKWRVSNETLSAFVLNAFLGRPDLGGASMSTLPYAISRRALRRIGADGLAKPWIALAKAVKRGLSVETVSTFRIHPPSATQEEMPPNDLSERIALGDCFEAIAWLRRNYGARGGLVELDERGGRPKKVKR
jgi:glycosyltransferase involved in cell wall biosynthesis